MKTAHQQAKQFFWDGLPAVFGLPGWAELERSRPKLSSDFLYAGPRWVRNEENCPTSGKGTIGRSSDVLKITSTSVLTHIGGPFSSPPQLLADAASSIHKPADT
ncbi:hypothetical protein C8R44DRAFT_736151 [Mycena epipterygia]|nr:hypothetical protein C8R44DRAFT_736151 [Mycena epipterygia]